MTAPDRFMYGAVDLSQVKTQAEARDTPAGEIPALAEITAANLEAAVLHRSTQVPVVVLVGTPRSPDSEQLKADLEALAQQSQRAFLVGYVDADRAPEVAQAFGIQGLPTVVAVAAGRPITSFEGGQPFEALKQWTDALVAQVGGQLSGLSSEIEGEAPEQGEMSELDYAIAVAAQGQWEQAEQIFAALAQGGAQGGVKGTQSAQPQKAQGSQASRAAAYRDLIARVRAASEKEGQEQDALARADQKALAGHAEEAFDLLLSLLSTERKEEAKARLLELFGLFEPADGAVAAARTRLASALF
ncbi:tetratricopeptide repeat protein [Corynebacterium lowii]|uniref:Thioredoxin n=1 Tax=Corynebacterium lowii TaxID=1544413 RepID=A0A0N8W0D2_9CORY|nr:tetratricopeptide repeat protein [Corynebacterium lowii]KQB86370.1 Thioredoxin [Corynebacterium lowii]MDP9850855.1 putative thioredoxin [Corynebacterium lowii]